MQVKMAYKLKTALGKAIYGARKYPVDPMIGIIKEMLGFCQFSLFTEHVCQTIEEGSYSQGVGRLLVFDGQGA